MFENWPLAVEVKPHTELVELSTLKPNDKRIVWKHIQHHKPALAEVIAEINANDELQALIKLTGATLCVAKSDLLSGAGHEEITQIVEDSETSRALANRSAKR